MKYHCTIWVLNEYRANVEADCEDEALDLAYKEYEAGKLVLDSSTVDWMNCEPTKEK